MDNRAEVRAFLTSRRARVTPEQVGLPSGTNRRVAGLRRSEVAALAGVSIEYYTKLRHFAVGLEASFVFMALTQTIGLSGPTVTLRYSF